MRGSCWSGRCQSQGQVAGSPGGREAGGGGRGWDSGAGSGHAPGAGRLALQGPSHTCPSDNTRPHSGHPWREPPPSPKAAPRTLRTRAPEAQQELPLRPRPGGGGGREPLRGGTAGNSKCAQGWCGSKPPPPEARWDAWVTPDSGPAAGHQLIFTEVPPIMPLGVRVSKLDSCHRRFDAP